MTVHKFGGTSVGNAARILRAAELVVEGGPPGVVVVSAMAGVTDLLGGLVAMHRTSDGDGILNGLSALRERHLLAARALGGDADDTAGLEARVKEVCKRLEGILLSPPAATGAADPLLHARLTDEVSSAGEDLSAELMAAALERAGLASGVVDARSLIRTDATFGHAVPMEEVIRSLAAERLSPLLAEGVVPVVQGFVGSTVNGVTTTLGRGGSDFTAAILASALGAREVVIWTDVDGLLSADPRAVDGALLLEEVGFEEAVELAYFGARVIHSRAAKWAVSRGVSIRIRNSFSPPGQETVIRWDRRGSPQVAAVAYKPGVILIKVGAHPTSLPYGFLAGVFDVLARHRLPVDLVATSHSSTAFTIDENEEVGPVSVELGEVAEVEVVRNLATVTVVGHGLMEEPGVNGRVFEAVGNTPVHLISQASDVSVSFLVAESDAEAVVQRVHRRLIAPRKAGRPRSALDGTARRDTPETEGARS